jgi:hypothetical protein
MEENLDRKDFKPILITLSINRKPIDVPYGKCLRSLFSRPVFSS